LFQPTLITFNYEGVEYLGAGWMTTSHLINASPSKNYCQLESPKIGLLGQINWIKGKSSGVVNISPFLLLPILTFSNCFKKLWPFIIIPSHLWERDE
jgi:hypothetical protein